MGTKKTSGIPDRAVATYNKILDTVKGIQRKGATMPYTSVNGHMFSFLAKDGSMALRLPISETEKFIKKHQSKLCEANGAVLKEYVVIPDELFHDEKQLSAYFKASFEYVSSLKPKPTTKSTRATKTTEAKKAMRQTGAVRGTKWK